MEHVFVRRKNPKKWVKLTIFDHGQNQTGRLPREGKFGPESTFSHLKIDTKAQNES